MDSVNREILDAFKAIFEGKLLPEFDNDESRGEIVLKCIDAKNTINERELRKIFGETE
jgi:hypothetical protein